MTQTPIDQPKPTLELPRTNLVTSGWLGALAATLIGGILRFYQLGRPHALIFDETYYAKDALSLLKYGYERKAIDGADAQLLSGNTNIFQDASSYVVHPPVGKWMIAFGEQIFGATPFGWRIMMAVLGTASVLLTARIARRLTNSNVIGTTAGLLLALDGLHITMSRTALLDMTLSFFVLCGFGFMILDRDLRNSGVRKPLLRVWFVVMLGLATATKWSGLYFLGAFMLLMFYWDLHREEQKEEPISGNFVARQLATYALMPISVIAIYVSSWVGWFRTSGGWNRDWTTSSWIPDALAGLWHYHHDMWDFHTHLTSDHNYKANPFGWPLMIRPTSFFYETADTCGSAKCAQEVIPIGNIVIWWLGALALVALVYLLIKRLHGAALPILVAFIAGWAPWLIYYQRTTFTFYAVAFIPYTVMALSLCLYLVTHLRNQTDTWNWQMITFLVVVAAITIYFYPVLTAGSVSYDSWHTRMWLPSWI